jgi:hypothetical protein
VASSRDASERLARLEQILSETSSASNATPAANTDAAQVHLDALSTERIRRLTAELQETSSFELDESDAVVMKLLLNEYSSAVGHLRAVARIAAATVDGVTARIREAERAIHRHIKTLDAHAADWHARNDARD